MKHSQNHGVLDKKYAAHRVEKPHLAFRYRTRAHTVFEAVKEHLDLDRPIRLLDMGCAEGRTLLELRTLLGEGQEYIGVECSEDLLSQAPTLPSGVKLIQGDVTHLPADLSEGHYDVVSALAILEHLDNPASALEEARRILRPGGIIVVTNPVPLWDRIASGLGLLQDDQHVMDIDFNTLQSLAKASGLEVVEYFRFMWAPIGFLPYFKIPVGIKFARDIDRKVSHVPLLNKLFVNQCFVARK